MKPISRRRWLAEALALASLPRALAAAPGGEEFVDFSDYGDFTVELQAANPRVKFYDLRRLADPITPTAEFFVFHQTGLPEIDLRTWRLEVGGCVERPAAFTREELLRRFGPEREVEFTLECSGNLPRSHTMNGQVGNARWAGVSLAEVLRHCGIKPEAREVVFFGADQVRDSAGVAYGPHGRSVFVQDALEADAILATKMNGRPLPPEHGFPLRVILPGWYGMTQIKWLTRIELMDRRYEGPHMSRNYHTLHVLPGTSPEAIVAETSISRTRLKSVVARVTRRRRDGAWAYRVAGAAWGGPAPIERVEVSVDRGPWREARIEERRGRYAWLLWTFDWEGARPGRHTLCSRAIDAVGRTQPSADEWSGTIRSARENNSQWEREIVLPA